MFVSQECKVICEVCQHILQRASKDKRRPHLEENNRKQAGVIKHVLS